MTSEQFENKGRKLLTEVLSLLKATDIKGTEGKYDRYDMTANIQGGSYIFEIKCRSSIFSEMYLVEDKARAILDEVKSGNHKGGYFVIFNGDRCYMWSTNFIIKLYQEGNTRQEWLPNTSCSENLRNQKKVLKNCILLPIKDAIRLEKKNNRWEKQL